MTCPSGSHCGLLDADGQGVCLNTCATNTDCRTPDYECFDGDGDAANECLPVASGPGAVGDACTSTYSDCGGGQLGICEAAFEEWGLQNYGGYCTQYCSTSAPCPTGSHCGLVGVPAQDWGYCLADCTSGADCRATGYLCADGDYAGTDECFPAGTGTATPGQPCEGVWECAGGVDGICFPPDATFKDGYCSQWCNPDAGVNCPSGTHCTAQAGSNSWGRCLDDCGNNTHCRGAGYACYNADGITGNECWYSGTGTGVVGAACAGIWDCAGGQYAACQTGWADGYCLIDCSSAYGTTCPAGSTCADWTPSDTTDAADYCVDDCGTAGDCRSAYDCYDGFGNGTSACLPQ